LAPHILKEKKGKNEERFTVFVVIMVWRVRISSLHLRLQVKSGYFILLDEVTYFYWIANIYEIKMQSRNVSKYR
jgi:hypothetical protein